MVRFRATRGGLARLWLGVWLVAVSTKAPSARVLDPPAPVAPGKHERSEKVAINYAKKVPQDLAAPVIRRKPQATSRGDGLVEELSRHFRLQDGPAAPSEGAPRPELPAPHNLSVLVLSWYPPSLRLSWDLDSEGTTPGDRDYDPARVAAAARRGLLLRRALAGFHVTYNPINSRFRITEEYPPYLRSVLLERLAPATEYSLQVTAAYLNGTVSRTSERVHFVSPTDNESRRFKEGSYRPIHRHPPPEEESERAPTAARIEELVIVLVALLFWLATICLFINKWGRIRMLEPYLPAYRAERTSLTLAVVCPPPTECLIAAN